MDPITQQTALASAGAAGAGEALYVDDVFSTYLYRGNGTTKRIYNNIDVDGEGGLVWIKNRDNANHSHILADKTRGALYALLANADTRSDSYSGSVTNFHSDGFTVGNMAAVNTLDEDFVSWTFRKCPGFLDIVTYDGTGEAQSIPHNLGSVPGMILIKCTSEAKDWSVYHRSLGATKNMHLNDDSVADTQTGVFNDTEPTATHFTVNYDGDVNKLDATYIAYLFAHDDQSFGANSDESIIKCDSYVGAGSNNVKEVTVGFEPQWLLIKKTDGQENWMFFDSMRGVHAADGADDAFLAQTADTEQVSADRVRFTPTGFELYTGNMSNELNKTFAYVAIRRPNKPPEAATDVFKQFSLSAGEGADTFISTGFPVDTFIYRKKETGSTVVGDRLRGTAGGGDLKTNSTDQEATNSGAFFLDHSDGVTVDFSGGHSAASPAATDSSYIRYFFRRAPGFFDVVTYEGTGSPQNIPHNLGVKPELIIVKDRDNGTSWAIQAGPLGATDRLRMPQNGSTSAITSYWNDTEPTSSVFTVGGDNNTGASSSYIAYLFASLDGISKIGTYDGSSSNLDVNCGFASGARFVLIKRTDGIGDWWIFDSARGINAGGDPRLQINDTNAEDSSTDLIDPNGSGFTVVGGDTLINNTATGAKFLYLAIA